jgi:hypothetical protein
MDGRDKPGHDNAIRLREGGHPVFFVKIWIPACAGMYGVGEAFVLYPFVPAKAGTQGNQLRTHKSGCPLSRARTEGGTPDQADCRAFASSIACQMRAGVIGISRCLMAYSDSASITALATDGRPPDVPASPHPLAPRGLLLVGTG